MELKEKFILVQNSFENYIYQKALKSLWKNVHDEKTAWIWKLNEPKPYIFWFRLLWDLWNPFIIIW